MKLKVITGIPLTLFIVGILTLSFNIQPIKAELGTIYIRSDGSVDPPTAPISTDDNVTYTLIGNITIVGERNGIVVERNDIVIDGAGYTVQGTGSGAGILVSEFKCNVTIKNTEIKAFESGILLYRSSNITLSGNVMNDNKYNLDIWDDETYNMSHLMHSIDFSNLVNGKPVYYLVNQRNLMINYATHPEVGYLALISCDNVTVEGLILTKNRQGLILANTSNSRITNNNITNNLVGICLNYSSSYNSISGNNITNNEWGIWLTSSPNNMLRGNIMANNTYNFWVVGWGVEKQNLSLQDFANDVDTSNTVDGKPVYYWIDKENVTVPSNAGCVIIINCTNIIIQNLSLTNNGQGILLAFTTNSMITQNNITNNVLGIALWGVASNNTFYHNNFINNKNQVYDYVRTSDANTWDASYPSGGNYWSNYAGVDLFSGPYQNETGSDGIGDTPYTVWGVNNQDRFPLMRPWSPLPIKVFDVVWEDVHYSVPTLSNYSATHFIFNQTLAQISFKVTGESGTVSYCNVTIPNNLLWGEFTVLIDGNTPLQLVRKDNATHISLYFTYELQSTGTVQIIGTEVVPEFPTWTSMLLLLTVLSVVIAIYKRRLPKTPIH